MMEPAGTGDPAPRAFLRLGGASLARHQLSLALSAGCTRIIGVARGITPELIELQHEAERAGASFHLVSGPRGLSPLVTAADEVLVLTEGVHVAADDVLPALEAGPVVVVQPAEIGIPAGYERIDLNHASAGVFLLPGRLLERLMELPDDVDPASSLMRIALQAGVRQMPQAQTAARGDRWLMIRTEAEADAAENGWIERATAAEGGTPGPYLARLLIRRVGPAALHGGSGPMIGAFTAAVIAAIGLAAAWFGYPAAGMVLAGAGWVARRATSMLERLVDQMLARPMTNRWREPAFDLLFDVVLAAILVMALPTFPGERMVERWFAPVVLLGLVRLLARTFRTGWSPWVSDRLILALLLALMISGNVADLGVPAFVILLLAAGLVLPREQERPARG